MAVKFTQGATENQLIDSIVARAVEMAESHGNPIEDHLSLRMDISAVNASSCSLDLNKLLKADDFNFAHDVFGISRHINRRTGKLGGYFLPRCVRKEAV